MNSRTLIVVLSLSGLVGASAPLMAETLHCKTRKDYVSAMLSYDEKLKKDPFNQKAMKQLMACHEAMLQNEQAADAEADAAKQRQIVTAQAAARSEFPDLPEFSDDQPRTTTIASKP